MCEAVNNTNEALPLLIDQSDVKRFKKESSNYRSKPSKQGDQTIKEGNRTKQGGLTLTETNQPNKVIKQFLKQTQLNKVIKQL